MLYQDMMECIWDICNEEKHHIQETIDFDTLHIFMFDKV